MNPPEGHHLVVGAVVAAAVVADLLVKLRMAEEARDTHAVAHADKDDASPSPLRRIHLYLIAVTVLIGTAMIPDADGESLIVCQRLPGHGDIYEEAVL